MLDFYRRTYASDQADTFQVKYQVGGLDNFFRVSAQRCGQVLVASFTDVGEQHYLAAEEALRARQARAQTAAHRELQRVFEQAPAAIAVYRGPNHVIELANPTVDRLWGRTQEQLLGKGLFEALPEVAGLGYEELLDGVMATGEPHVAYAMEAQHDRNGHRETVYWDFVYVPMYDDAGHIDGAMVVANEVTEQVRARRKMEQLNQELEMRVTARSAETRAALFEAEQQREQLRTQQALLGQILGQVPAFIATLSGPEHRFTFLNGLYIN